MDLAGLIAALAEPAAYPFPVEAVTVCQTHISAVFLAGPFAYKIKKPVRYSFLDFSTLGKRLHYCHEEVRLNRRLAPDVYRGVVPVCLLDSQLKFEGQGETVEWAVKMQRLPEEATLRDRLLAHQVGPALVEALAARLAEFHRSAEPSAGAGRFPAVQGILLEIFKQSEPQVGNTVSPAVFTRLRTLTDEGLARWRPLIEARAEQGRPRDCHGDLHLDHVYYFPERAPPGDLVIVDCIEFNERFRYIDPVADMAFPAMDLAFYGRRDLARVFSAAYFRAARDDGGRPLVPLYTAYRASVRGSVEGLKLAEQEVTQAERQVGLQQARAHWLLALVELEEPGRRPALVLVGGLPGTGKSSLARGLAERAGFTIIRADVVRKELAGLAPDQPAPPAALAKLYSPEWNERTYGECLRRAEELLFQGQRVIVDATFRAEAKRRAFLDAAQRWAVPGVLLVCRADPETVRRRLEQRQGDVSDADWSVHELAARQWEEPGEWTRAALREVDTTGNPEKAITAAVQVLKEEMELA